MTTRYDSRTVEWGNWGITFMDPQPDRTKNFGVVVWFMPFPVGTRGPVDMPRDYYTNICRAWTERGELPC